jgi:hypothetical protein
LSLPKRPTTLLLLLLFVLGELVFSRLGLVHPVLAPAAAGWRELCRGAYVAEEGYLVPENTVRPILKVVGGRVVALHPDATLTLDPQDTLDQYGHGTFAVLRQGAAYVEPVPWQGRWLFADAQARNLWLVAPGATTAEPLLPDVVAGIDRQSLMSEHPGWHLLWALAPLPLTAHAVLYVSNRSDPGGVTLSLWRWQDGLSAEVVDGTPYRSVWPLGADDGLVYLADGKGDVLLLVSGLVRTLATDLEPVAFGAGAGVLAASLTTSGRVAVVGPNGPTWLALPAGQPFAGLGAFAPGGGRVALFLGPGSDVSLWVASRTAAGWGEPIAVSLPVGWHVDRDVAPSWLGRGTLVVTLLRAGEPATFAYAFSS